MKLVRIVGAAMVWLLIGSGVFGQQSCSAPAIPAVDARQNMFTAAQERDVGDALAEQIQRDFLVIDDPDLTSYMQAVGDRLLHEVPQTDEKVRFFLSDMPVTNAFSFPGARVYVSRKMISFVRSEDELASVLGHELGHVLSKQPAIHVSRLFREVLGVTEPGDRAEIFRHYADLQDNLRKKNKAFGRPPGQEQQEQ